MCGIFGIYDNTEVFPVIASALTTLQHRGQDSAGIATLKDTFHIKKGKGLAHDIFSEEDAAFLQGNLGLGHIRYSTQGTLQVKDAQPFMIHHPFGLSMVHNGNVTNFASLKQTLVKDHLRLMQTSSDVELILYTFGLELEKKKIHKLSPTDIFDAVTETQKQIEGAYAACAAIAHHGLLAFMDPNGIRPLILGKKETVHGISYAFASETAPFDYLGYDVIHHLTAGEAIYIDQDKKVHSKICHKKQGAFCVFEYIYLGKEDSILQKKLVASEREKMGRRLAHYFKEEKLQPDVVIDVPSSSYFFAQGLAEELGIPYRRGLVKNNFSVRSFIAANQEAREKIVKQKHNPIRSIIEGKKVAVIDDSIVRGTTSKHIVQLIRKAGAKEVYFASGSPPVISPCIYGIDMSQKKEMIAQEKNIEEIREFIEADALIYLKVDDLKEIYDELPICSACFTGEYPTNVCQDTLQSIEQDKVLSCR